MSPASPYASPRAMSAGSSASTANGMPVTMAGDISFEQLVAEIGAQFLARFNPERECCLIAELDGRRVGSAFIVQESNRVAKLRLVIVDPQARGHGIGKKLVGDCIAFARPAAMAKSRCGRMIFCMPPAPSMSRRVFASWRKSGITASGMIWSGRTGCSICKPWRFGHRLHRR